MKKFKRKPKDLWGEWKASLVCIPKQPSLWQFRCGKCYGGPHGAKDARRLAKFLNQYADWADWYNKK